MRFFLTTVLLIALGSPLNAQDDSVSVMFYNVENLFDTEDDSTKNDNEFLPTSKKKWDNFKLNSKITKIAKVIAAGNFPDIIGLSEIENKSVLENLTNHYILRKHKYKIIHFESPDQRGIDCALIYKQQNFDLLKMNPVAVQFNGRPTRDILEVKLTSRRDTINLFVNHWPSRYGGKNRSEIKRINAANKLKSVLDSLTKSFLHQKIIAMGDFNDEPKDSSLKILRDYKNVSDKIHGTIKYRGKWQNFDQFITSKNFDYNITTLKFDFLLEEDKSYGGYKPNRTYYGPMYHGGFSDHLPILLTFSLP